MIFYASLSLAAIVKALMDWSSEDRFPFGSPYFWNKSPGAARKWKNGRKQDGERFFGSSTFLVFLTDGWHLLQAGFLSLIFAALVSYQPVVSRLWDFVIFGAGFRIVFQCVYWLNKEKK